MAITFISPKMKGLKVNGVNINLKGETVPWDGIATGATQIHEGRKDYLVLSRGPHWLNRETFSGVIGTYRYEAGKHVGYTTDVKAQAPETPKPVTCTVNGKVYVAHGNKWVPVQAPKAQPVQIGDQKVVLQPKDVQVLGKFLELLKQLQVA